MWNDCYSNIHDRRNNNHGMSKGIMSKWVGRGGGGGGGGEY